MITAEHFAANKDMRNRLSKALDDILELAFLAADRQEEDDSLSSPLTGDAVLMAMRQSEHVAIARYKSRLRKLAGSPPAPVENLIPDYSADPFEQLAQEPIENNSTTEPTIHHGNRPRRRTRR